LKELLQKRQLPMPGNKLELIVRLQMADPEGQWMRELENMNTNTAAYVEVEIDERADIAAD